MFFFSVPFFRQASLVFGLFWGASNVALRNGERGSIMLSRRVQIRYPTSIYFILFRVRQSGHSWRRLRPRGRALSSTLYPRGRAGSAISPAAKFWLSMQRTLFLLFGTHFRKTGTGGREFAVAPF